MCLKSKPQTRLEIPRIIVELLRQESAVVAVSSCPAAGIPGACKSALCSWFSCDKIPHFLLIKEEKFNIMAETATWLVMSEGMGDGGLDWLLASWETKPESWEETLLSR